MDIEKMTAKVQFDANGLVPAIVQDNETQTVLMLAYMDRSALAETLATGYTCFYSRSRQCLWHKGETSGHIQKVCDIYYDCDADSLLVKVEQTGGACHTGTYSCFSRKLDDDGAALFPQKGAAIISEVYEVIRQRQENPQEGSYTSYLFSSGQDKILKKIGEEATETVIASKNKELTEILYEMADLWYHCLVVLVFHNITPDMLFTELRGRRK